MSIPPAPFRISCDSVVALPPRTRGSRPIFAKNSDRPPDEAQPLIQVATADDRQLQNVLMDAFDEGLVSTNNFAQARKIISARARDPKSKSAAKYTVTQLRHDIEDATRAKTSYVREAKTKENRFMALLSGINLLWKDEAFVELLREEKLPDRPELAGDFRYEP